jgi:hypothetical protein
VGAGDMMMVRQTGSSMKRSKRVSIAELLDYWTEISRRPSLTLDDYALFLERAKDSLAYFAGFNGWYVTERGHLTNNKYAQMKYTAKGFITRIRKCFGSDVIAAINTKMPLQDAEALLASSTKLTYRWAAGIIASNHIATLLIQLSGFRTGEKYKDDINTLYANLKNRTSNRKLKTFLTRSYRRFEDADRCRETWVNSRDAGIPSGLQAQCRWPLP